MIMFHLPFIMMLRVPLSPQRRIKAALGLEKMNGLLCQRDEYQSNEMEKKRCVVDIGGYQFIEILEASGNSVYGPFARRHAIRLE